MIGNYNGGKGLIFRHLINQIPPHQRYIELFLGGGSVMLHKKPASVNIGIDMDVGVIDAWRRHMLPSSAAAAITKGGGTHRYLSPQVAVTPGNAKSDGTAAPPQAKMLATRNPAAATAKGGGTRYQFINMDALAWLDNATIALADFIYSDQPYLMDTRSNQRALYTHEFATPEEHEALLGRLLELDCMVMVSGYWSELYADLLPWRTMQIETRDRAGNPKTEWLWMNYPEPKRLHDYSWLGDDYREREKLAKRKRRAVRKYSKMPRLERLSLMSALEEAGLL